MTRGKSNKRSLDKNPLFSEKGTIVRKWRNRIPVCVVYPNSYYIGMSNLATHILYRTLNSIPEIVCERCFLEGDGEIRSIESGRPLGAFECIFFSLSFELDFVNIPRILTRSGLTVLASKRKDGHPIVIAGGICAMANPEPVSSFVDLFIMGDIEATIPLFANRYMEKRGIERENLVENLSSFDWVYNPKMLDVSYGTDGVTEAFSPQDFSVTIRRYKGKNLGTSAIMTGNTEFSGMFLLEGTRGCPSRCPFCLLGNAYPFTYDRLSDIGTDVRDIGIIGGGVSFHPHLAEIIRELKGMGKRVHLPSLRIDEVPLSVIELIKDEVKTLTFGIEAGSERLRRFIGKALAAHDIYDKMDAILAIKPFNLKLYFMIGLYGEERSDLEGILETVKHIKHLMVKKGAARGVVGTITVHVSPFVPKASTPFQWLPMEDMAVLKEKVAWLKKGFARVDNTFFTHESVKYSLVQGILARGDRRTGDMILRFSSGESFSKVLREHPINLNFYTLRRRERNELFPWDFIRGKTRKERLYTILKPLISGTELGQSYP
ncbi:MAG: Radical SAM superfamily protein [Syntrophorhabdus sp. PtaB.Bin006]|nr:MAG: Radical SAM superfamily protein [Syntrophorhabdus sp. PtaB.Bin006]